MANDNAMTQAEPSHVQNERVTWREAVIDAALAGVRLDIAARRLIPDLSRARAQKLIAAGFVTLDDAVVTDSKRKVTAGEKVGVHMPSAVPAAPRGEARALSILHEDADLLVLDKPPGLVVHPGAGNLDGTLVNALIAHCGDSLSGIGGVKRPGIVHRLDKDTSGVMVVAKTDRAHQALAMQFAACKRTAVVNGADLDFARCYLALVWGAPVWPSGTVDAPLGRDRTNRQKMAVDHRGRSARTHWRIHARYGPPDAPHASLIKCRLETGRTHQIRVHMAHIGHPLVGDPTYGAGFRSKIVRLPAGAHAAAAAFSRQALHATVLAFRHPITEELMRFETLPPADMAALIAAFAAQDDDA